MIKQFIQVGVWGVILSIGISGYSQIKKEKQADKSFDQLAFVNAIQSYERLVDKGYVNVSIIKNLADAYYYNGKLIEANKWYTELFEGNYEGKNLSELSPEYYYRYAQTLKAVRHYEKAQEIMDLFASLKKGDKRAMLYSQNRDYLKILENNYSRYNIEEVTFNTVYSDYGGTIYGDYLIFTSARKSEQVKEEQRHAWTNESFTKLYKTVISKDGFGKPEIFAPELESKVNEATAIFTKDEQTMYFTRNNSNSNGKGSFNEEKKSLLKIYKSLKQLDGKWGMVEELPFNVDNFNTAHPALSPDEKWLYFASDRMGTVGSSDLFRVARFQEGGYGVVEHLGDKINTEGRETFPFISSDYNLYFASDGHPGFGGLDVFVTKLYPDGSIGPVMNMGMPINSSLDDFSFYFDSKERKGFVSSNRSNGKEVDDIYFITEKSCKQSIEGVLYEKESNEVLNNVLIVISQGLGQKSDSLYTDAKGVYRLDNLDCSIKYRVKAEKQAYYVTEVILDANHIAGVKTVNIGLEKEERPLAINDDLFKRLKLKPIYFDFDKDNIRADAAIELIKIVELMKKYPEVKIDIRSHTDSRGNDIYNMELSDRRVKSTIEWMVDQGIELSRLTGRGYGESQLLNKCDDIVHCSESDHQQNRRSEFIIVLL